MNFHDLLRGLTPPLLKSAISRLQSLPTTYSGPYPTWGLASAAASGYSHAEIIGRVESATRSVLRGESDHEQDGVAFPTPATAAPALAGLLLGAALDGGHLRVLDFGGSLGSHYLKWRRFFDRLESVQWQVVEQQSFVDVGRALFKDLTLPISFHASLAAANASRPSAVLLGSVLQYLEFPLETLAQLRDIGPRVLIVDRTPFTQDGGHHIMVQHVSPRIYPGSYPMHSLSRPALDSVLGEKYELLHEYDDIAAPASVAGVSATFQGSIWINRGWHDR